MGGIFPKAPAMPSAEEQYAIQKKLADQSASEAADKAEKARRKAALEEKRRQAGKVSLMTPRMGGLFGTLDTTGDTEYQSLYTGQ